LGIPATGSIWIMLAVVGAAVPTIVALPPLLFGDALVRKAIEIREDLRGALAQASMASQAKSQFLATMSHEIRTPLNGVIGLTDVLENTRLDESQREIVGLIRSSGETLERLVSDVLDASKIEAGKLELVAAPFELAPTVEAAAYLLRARAAEKGLTFDIAISDAARGWFMGDAVRIRQIIANLASNAIKFTDTGSVSLQVDAVPAGAAEARIEITVRDTGIGFSASTAERLFGRFEQADSSISRRFGGTGLGLSICKSLAELMDGAVTASSVEGAGSTFTVTLTLPRAPRSADGPTLEAGKASAGGPLAAPASTGDVPPPAAGPPLAILVAEDNPVNQRVITMMLETLGADVVMAADGVEALALFEARPFDLVLMDMMMPNMDGLAATRAIRAAEQARSLDPVPVIMLSANAMPDHVAAALEAGCNAHIAKPVTAQTLFAGIQAALDGPGDCDAPSARTDCSAQG
jgi:signal transduction histidine kinase/CheY-like chemotaxis protein